MLVDHNPTLPNRHDAIAGRAPGLGSQLAAMAANLEDAGADFIVMVCNTAHAYQADIEDRISVPFVSIVEATVDALEGSGARQVGLMAAEGCLQAGLYQRALSERGYTPVLWSEPDLEAFMALVYRVKAGDRGEEVSGGMIGLAEKLVLAGADTLLAACTEVPLVLGDTALATPILSSTDLLVQRTIQLAQGDH
jgi:aspartate racemase